MSRLTILTSTETRQFDTPPRFTKEERQRYFSIPTHLKPVVSRINRAEYRVGFVLQLGYFRATARFFRTEDFKQRDISYVRRQLRCKNTDLAAYAGAIKTRHRRTILAQLDWQEVDVDAKEQLVRVASHYANQQEHPKQILSALVDSCWKNQVVIPSYRELSEIITNSFNEAERGILAAVEEALEGAHREQLESLLQPLKRSARVTLAITQYKTIDQSIRPQNIAKSTDVMKLFRDHFISLKAVFEGISLNDKATKYYADWLQKADYQQLTQFPNRYKVYLHLLAFIKHQFYKRQDSLVDTLLKCVTATSHKAKSQLALHEQSIRAERDKAIQALSQSHKSISELAKGIIAVVNAKGATPNEKYYKIEELVHEFQADDEIDTELLEALEDQLQGEQKKQAYYELLEMLSLKLQRRVSSIVKALCFDEDSEAGELLEAIKHFRETDGGIGHTPPVGFLNAAELAVVTRDDKIVIPLYKCLLFFHIATAIKAGKLNLRYSYRYRAIQDYLIDKAYWQKNKAAILRDTGMLAFVNGNTYLEILKESLNERYSQVNEYIAKGENLYFSRDQYGNPRIRTPRTDFEDKSFISDTLSQDGYIPILQLLKEVNQACAFTESFKHLSPKNVKMKPSEEVLMAGILGKGCNIGISKLASISAGIREHILHNTVTWFFDIDNIRNANRKIVTEIHKLALANNYLYQPPVIHSSSDGRKINVAVDCLHANHSFKYFGKDKGVTIYTFIDERQSLFHNTVFSSSDREAPYVIDGLMENPVPVEGQVHSTDTHGFTEQIFAATHFLGVGFAPRLKNLCRQRIYGFSAKKTYRKKGYKLLPSRTINQKLILRHWDDILRFIATIKSHHATASQLFKRLSSYAQDHPLYKALKEFGRIIKSQFILTYYDDVELRQQIQKQLNRVELSNKFSRAVFFDNDQAFQEGSREEQESASACKLLLQNSIILWNYLYLSELIVNTDAKEDRANLIQSISQGSVITWRHVNLRGEYDFRRKVANDSRFDLERIKALQIQ